VSTRPSKPGPATPAPGKIALPELVEMKRRGERIVMVTAYDAPGARFADAAGIDLILVGDTAAMVVLGHESTVPVTMDEMLSLTRTVTRAAKRPLVIGDMPFGTYEASDEDAVHNAVRFVKEGGADVVKLEGAGPSVARVRAITGAGIGVMGHVGLTPQSATVLGGFKAQGRTAEQALRLYDDALELERAGCFAIVLEAVPEPVAARITAALSVPTIGIGAVRGATVRCSSTTTCSACTRAARPASSSATPTLRPRFAGRSSATPPTSARAHSPRSSTPTRCRTRSSSASRAS
jgi:3-methyl-2-oxobutanoate hydroxymethyltransferase